VALIVTDPQAQIWRALQISKINSHNLAENAEETEDDDAFWICEVN
jgi:hypothetical protein